MAGAVILEPDDSRTARRVPLLELAVQTTEGVRVAAAAGAARVELCSALAETDGITPGTGLVAQASEAGLPVHVLIRPRAGGFVYTPEDLDVMEREVVAALGAGASGVVIGMLAADGGPYVAAARHLSEVAKESNPAAEVTFHRAFDAALSSGMDPAGALARLQKAGVDRVLTSGGAADCTGGLRMLATLVALGREIAPSVQIMAGGGVTLGVVPGLLDAGVHAVHTSARLARTPAGNDAADPILAAAFAAAVQAGA